jgi:hypothetical protein
MRLEEDVEDEFDLGAGLLVGCRAVPAEIEGTGVVEGGVGVRGVTVEIELESPRGFEGTTVCVEVVDIEDDEDEDVAGECDLGAGEDGEGTLMV